MQIGYLLLAQVFCWPSKTPKVPASPDPQTLQTSICVSWLQDASWFSHFHYLFLLLRMFFLFALLHKHIPASFMKLSQFLPTLSPSSSNVSSLVMIVSLKPSLLSGALKQLPSPGWLREQLCGGYKLFLWGSHDYREPIIFSQLCMLSPSDLKAQIPHVILFPRAKTSEQRKHRWSVFLEPFVPYLHSYKAGLF